MYLDCVLMRANYDVVLNKTPEEVRKFLKGCDQETRDLFYISRGEAPCVMLSVEQYLELTEGKQ